jgi:hypothetical protein
MGSKSDPNKAAINLQREQMRRLEDISLPQLEEYILQSPELVGLLNAEQMEDSEFSKIQEDPRLREAQMQALSQLEKIGEVGLTPEERAQRSEMLRQGAAQEQARQQQILQGMAQRGALDSGSSLLAQLQSSAAQGADARRQSEQMAAEVAGRRRQALMQAGNMAGNMSQQQFNRQSQQATAQDRIAQFNAEQRANVNRMNLAARQGIENQRTGIANQQAQIANMIAQQRYQNELSRATGQGQVTNAMSTLTANQAQRPGALQAGLAGAASGALTGASIGAAGGPIGAGAGALLGAGAGIFSSFEDGGVIHASGGHKVPEEILGTSRNDYRNLDMDDIAAQNLQDAIIRQEQYENNPLINPTKDNKFKFDTPQFDAMSLKDVDSNLKKPELLVPKKERDVVAEAVQNTKLSPNEDMVAKSTDKKFDPKGLEAALKGLNKMFGEKPERKNIELPSFSPIQVQNAMRQMGNVDFSNPFSAEDGGLYQGTEYAEDGTVMFDSNGEGAVVGGDSYERDRVDARLNSGEAVLNAAQQQRLLDLLRGKESVDSLGEDDIIEGVPKQYHDELKTDIDKKRDVKQKGLEKLLKTLGE